MSYVLHVWDGPVPRRLEEADPILDELLRITPTGPQPRIDAFAKALWARFPRDICTDAEDPIWADDGLAGGHDGSAVLSLAPTTEHLDDTVPAVARMANEAGLVVFDPQYGTVYLPSGKVLGERPPAPPPGRPRPFSNVVADKRFRAAMKPVMAEAGFRPERRGRVYSSFFRRFEGGEHEILVMALRSCGTITLNGLFKTRLDAVDAVMTASAAYSLDKKTWEVASASLEELLRTPGAGRVPQRMFNQKGEVVVHSAAEVDEVVEILTSFFKERVFPALQRFETVHGVWSNALFQLNTGHYEVFRGSYVCNVVAGRLAGDPRFEKLGEVETEKLQARLESTRRRTDAPAWMPKHDEEYLQKFLALMAYLRTHVEPVAFP